MNDRHDNSTDDDVLSRRYRAASNETPPPAVDAAIRSAARASLATDGDTKRPRRANWQTPAAVAAVVLLSVSLVLRINEVPQGASDDAAPSSPAAPAEAQRRSASAERQAAAATPDATANEAERSADREAFKASDVDSTTQGFAVGGARRERAAAADAASAARAPQPSTQAEAEPQARVRAPAGDAPFDAATLEALAAIALAWESGDVVSARERLALLREARPELTDEQLAAVLPEALIAP